MIKNLKILADLVEPGDTVIDPATDEPGVVARIRRASRRFKVQVNIELEDGRTIEIGGSKYLRQAAAS